MCFTISEKYTNELTAEEDIKVYKHGTSKCFDWIYLSPYQHFEYLRFKKQKKIYLVPYVTYFLDKCIDNGYHSYKELKTAQVFEKHENSSVYEFKIPKGAKYYKNDTEIVSNQIIYIKKIK